MLGIVLSWSGIEERNNFRTESADGSLEIGLAAPSPRAIANLPGVRGPDQFRCALLFVLRDLSLDSFGAAPSVRDGPATWLASWPASPDHVR
jgi:hypothetical protein